MDFKKSKMAIKIIKYGGSITGLEEERAIIKSIRNSRKTRNWQEAEEGKLFSAELAKFLGVKYGILTNSGSSAGLLALSALSTPITVHTNFIRKSFVRGEHSTTNTHRDDMSCMK